MPEARISLSDNPPFEALVHDHLSDLRALLASQFRLVLFCLFMVLYNRISLADQYCPSFKYCFMASTMALSLAFKVILGAWCCTLGREGRLRNDHGFIWGFMLWTQAVIIVNVIMGAIISLQNSCNSQSVANYWLMVALEVYCLAIPTARIYRQMAIIRRSPLA